MNKDLHDKSMDKNCSNIEVYNSWSNTYEEYVKELEYTGPKNLVLFLKNLISETFNFGDNISILDFGCGTGLVGQEVVNNLSECYKITLDGLDISDNMLEKSREKQIYNNLWNIDISNKSLSETLQYNFIISSGVFLEGHVNFSIINNLLDYIKPKNHLIFTVRTSFMNKHFIDFQKYITKNNRCNMISYQDIEYLQDVKCKLIILYKIF